MRGRYQGHVFHAGKASSLQLPHKAALIHVGLGIRMDLRAVVTAAFPFLAVGKSKIGALPGKSPAVVESPDRGDTVLFYIAKQQEKIQVAPVEIVDMDDVRPYLVQASQQAQGTQAGEQAVKAGEPAQEQVQGAFRKGAEIAVARELRKAEAAVPAQLSGREGPDLVACLPGDMGYAQHDLTGASPVIGVYFNDLQYCITTCRPQSRDSKMERYFSIAFS